MLDLIRAVIGLGGVVIGAVIGFAFSEVKEYIHKAVLSFTDIELHDFRTSVRVILPVVHEHGSLPVNNASGYLTIYHPILGHRKSEYLPKDILMCKSKPPTCSFRCRLCDYMGTPREYLAPYPQAKVLSEVLPWTVPLKAGEGLDNLPYKHLTNIPVNGIAKLVLFDIFKVEDIENYERFYLVKVHSEYGTEYYPRVCLKLPLNQKWKGELVFEVKASGENIRKQANAQIKIKYDNYDYVLEYHIKRKLKKKIYLGNIMNNKENLYFRSRIAAI